MWRSIEIKFKLQQPLISYLWSSTYLLPICSDSKLDKLSSNLSPLEYPIKLDPTL